MCHGQRGTAHKMQAEVTRHSSHTGNVHEPGAQGGNGKNWPSFCFAEGLRSSHSEPGVKDKRTHLIRVLSRAGLDACLHQVRTGSTP